MGGITMKFAAYALLGAAVASAAPALADVRAGVEAYQRGDYARALGGMASAGGQGRCGRAVQPGAGLQARPRRAANLDTALGFYRKAAAQNHEEAQALLGLLLFQNGKRAERCPGSARRPIAATRRRNMSTAPALFNGDMVGKDWPRAYALMTRAAAQGLPPARNAVVEMDKHIPLAQREQGVAMARAGDDRPAASRPAPVRTAAATHPPPSDLRPPRLRRPA
jgi:hypothetical protein